MGTDMIQQTSYYLKYWLFSLFLRQLCVLIVWMQLCIFSDIGRVFLMFLI